MHSFTIVKGNEILQNTGLHSNRSPFLNLRSLLIPKSLPQCRLHVMDLSLFDKLLVLTVSFLNSDGKEILNKVLQSNLLAFSNTSRLQCWKIKTNKQNVSSYSFNGDDVSELLPYFTLIWNFVLLEEYMNYDFYNIFVRTSKQITSYEKLLSVNVRTFSDCMYI